MIQWLTILLLATGYGVPIQSNVDEMLRVTAPKVITQPGKNSVINVSIEVKNGFHIQAHEVTDEFIIPTTLELHGDKAIIIRRIIFPPAKKFKLKGTDKHLDVYDGTFEIKAFFTTQNNIRKNAYPLNGKLKYQACDSMRCFSPRAIEFLINIQMQ